MHDRSDSQSPDRSVERCDRYREEVISLLSDLDIDVIALAADTLREAREHGRTVFIGGNGGSATTASHMVTDLMFGRGLPQPGLRVVGLADNQAVITATGNDVSFDAIFARQLRQLAHPQDILILISASGNSPNILKAAREGRGLGLTVIGLTGFDGGELAQLSDVSLHVASRPGAYGPVEDVHLVINHLLVEMLALEAKD